MFLAGNTGMGWNCCGGGDGNGAATDCCLKYVYKATENVPEAPAASPEAGDIPNPLADGQIIEYQYVDGIVRYEYSLSGGSWSVFTKLSSDLPEMQ